MKSDLRIPLSVSLTLVAWVLILLWLAHDHAPWGDVRSAHESVRAKPEQWGAVVGSLEPVENRVAVAEFDPTGAALLVWRPQPFAAESLPLLELEIEEFPYNYVLMLVWTIAGEQPAFQRLQLPNGGTQSYHLGRYDGWRGEVVEMALYMHPHQHNMPPEPASEHPRVRRLELHPDRHGGRVAALATGWFAADPWELLSVSSLGAQRDLDEGIRILPVVVLFWLSAWVIGGLTVGIRGWRRWLGLGLRSALVAAVALWLQWLINLGVQHQSTRDLFAGLDQAERQTRVFDADLVTLAAEARAVLPDPGQARIYVRADDRFFALRAAWHLRPHNVMTLNKGTQHIRAGDYVFYYRRPELDGPVGRGRLQLGDHNFSATLLSGGRNGNGIVRIDGVVGT